MNARAIEKEALELPVEKRAKLAQRLLESLENLTESEAEKLWLHEAERRANELDEGKVRLVKSEELERGVRKRLKGTTAVILQPDVAKVFQSAEAVNDLLRSAIAATGAAGAPKRRPKPPKGRAA